ncbi:hypothetical protein Clacol_004929 [Clathrus columnatus]|uniref:Uncharacterized protein n=1 Tax=Clathrus columnatus TaxID=1419009 RepID=A0AAV5AAH7_9AGAM|nr:hypothetical protein Clacol_004929 [Clathrus columnatus]
MVPMVAHERRYAFDRKQSSNRDHTERLASMYYHSLFHDYPPGCSIPSSDPVILQNHSMALRYRLKLFSHMMEFNLPKATPAAILAFSSRADAYLLKLNTSTTLPPGHIIAEEALERARRLVTCSLSRISDREWEKLQVDCKTLSFSGPEIDVCNLLDVAAGVWEGRLEYPNHSQYMALREQSARLDMYDNLFLTSLPVLCSFKVFYCMKHQEPLRQATEPDAILNAWLPPDSEIDIMIRKDGGLRIYDRILQKHVLYQRYCGKEGLPGILSEAIGDILIMGTTLSTNIGLDARYFGRVRLSDGLFIIVRDGPQIGREILRGYIHHNTNLVDITGRRSEVLENVSITYEGPGELVPFVGDVTKKEDIKNLVEFVKQRDQYINLLVNNAAVGGVKNDFAQKSSIEEFSEALFSTTFEEWNTTLHLNSTAMFFMAAAFLPLLAKGPNPGCIINVSSMSGITKQSQGGQFAYNASKAATISLTQQLAYEFRKPGLSVRVNAIAPGFFPSEMTPARIFSPDPDVVRAQWGVPLGRIGHPREYAQAILTLAVDTYMNGSVLLVDGGWLLEQS